MLKLRKTVTTSILIALSGLTGLLVTACGSEKPAASPSVVSAPSSAVPSATSAAPLPAQQSTPPASAKASKDCLAAMAKADDESDPDLAEPLIIKSLDDCGGAEDWLLGLRAYPGAMGLNELADLGSDSLKSVCFAAPDSRVCVDAEDQGLL